MIFPAACQATTERLDAAIAHFGVEADRLQRTALDVVDESMGLPADEGERRTGAVIADLVRQQRGRAGGR